MKYTHIKQIIVPDSFVLTTFMQKYHENFNNSTAVGIEKRNNMFIVYIFGSEDDISKCIKNLDKSVFLSQNIVKLSCKKSDYSSFVEYKMQRKASVSKIKKYNEFSGKSLELNYKVDHDVFIQMKSSSSGNRFSLFVKKICHKKNNHTDNDTNNEKRNSYGLSIKNKQVILPDPSLVF